ncbi:unnamed protein product [Peniophora sp. CBMAI 1063]|nr:unnamed protein product [Peniophora sp. CBMAI 1063]
MKLNDDPMTRPRVLNREWTGRKPSLSKATSLPVLALVPDNRPLFTCAKCGFTNRYPIVPICLFCAWTTPEAIAAFESALSRVRRRRISGPAPAPVSNATPDAIKYDAKCGKLNSNGGTFTKDTESMQIVASLDRVVAIGRGNIARARRKRLPHPCLPPPTTTKSARTPESAGSGAKPADAMAGSRGKRRRPEGFDSAHLGGDDRPSTAPQPAPSLAPPEMAARMRKRSSQSLRDRSPPSTIKRSAPPSSSGIPSSQTSRAPSPEPRLGSTERPYYTAIRKNMSRPTTPFIPTPSSSPPPAAYMPTRMSAENASSPEPSPNMRPSADYMGTTRISPEFGGHVVRPSADYATYSRMSGSSSLPPRRPGGSVSGEMELRMALAARRSEEGPPAGARQEYVFRETPAPPQPPRRPSRLRRIVRSMFFGGRAIGPPPKGKS